MNAPKLRFAPTPLLFPGISSDAAAPAAQPAKPRSFREDLLIGLSGTPKSIPCKYLYDRRGSELFDEICELPEYYPTRTELALTRDRAGCIAQAIGPNATLIEPGAGSTTKIRLLLEALEDPLAYLPVDISGAHLRDAVEDLSARFTSTWVHAVEADFTRPFELRAPLSEAGARVIYFPGSTIGNFEPAQAQRLLASFAAPLRPQDFVLLGWDRIKSPDVLVPAYADARGVTEAFIRNLLVRVRDELGANVDPEAFALDTRWQPEHERIRISLRPREAQTIQIGDRRFDFEAGEELFVEHSHKYSDARMRGIAEAAGLRELRTWHDPRGWFALSLLGPMG